MFKEIPGFEGYFAKTDGTIWSSFNKAGNRILVDGKYELKYSPGPKGYISGKFMKDGKVKHAFFHDLILLTFVGPRPTGYECRHINGNPSDNNLSNLCWSTAQENADDRTKHGTVAVGTQLPQSVLNDDLVKSIRNRYFYGESCSEIAKSLGLNKGTVYAVVSYRSWRHV